MRQLGPELWVHEPKVAMGGFTTQLRTTIVRLGDGRLWVHSPTPLSGELHDAIRQLGPVGCLVAASNFHNRWLLDWQAAYPGAQVFVTRGIPAKLPQLRDYIILDGTASPEFRDELDQVQLAGAPFFSETVFFHRVTGSLIVTDFVQNYRSAVAEGPLATWTTPLFKALGYRDVCLAPPLRLGLVLRDRAAFARAVAQVLAWEIDRIIVTHGSILEEEAHAVLATRCRALLSPASIESVRESA